MTISEILRSDDPFDGFDPSDRYHVEWLYQVSQQDDPPTEAETFLLRKYLKAVMTRDAWTPPPLVFEKERLEDTDSESEEEVPSVTTLKDQLNVIFQDLYRRFVKNGPWYTERSIEVPDIGKEAISRMWDLIRNNPDQTHHLSWAAIARFLMDNRDRIEEDVNYVIDKAPYEALSDAARRLLAAFRKDFPAQLAYIRDHKCKPPETRMPALV